MLYTPQIKGDTKCIYNTEITNNRINKKIIYFFCSQSNTKKEFILIWRLETILSELSNFPQEFQKRMKKERDNELTDAFEDGYEFCKIRVADLLIDSKLPEEEIIGLIRPG